jgi:hypothetical protein
MKKLLLIGLMLANVGVFAQQNIDTKVKGINRINPELLKLSLPVPRERGGVDGWSLLNSNPILRTPLKRQSNTDGSVSSGGTRTATASETILGNTYYDLQTNNSISDRIVNTIDGKISAVWTFSPDFASGYPNRGTGYNYYSGTWDPIPTARIENTRAGFTNVGVTLAGKEVVVAHGIQANGTSLGMLLTTRTQGSGSWNTNSTILGGGALSDTIDVWSKMAIGGTDGRTIHLIWRGGSANAKYYGQFGPIFYSRSTDNGVTWDKIQTLLPGLDSTYYLGWSADEYSIDAKDNTVAVVASATGSDVVMVKSTDNGDTWTRNVVFSYPIPFFDGGTMSTDTNSDSTPDTLWSGTGDANLVIDNNHNAQVVFSMVRTVGDGTNFSYYPYSSHIFYWNEAWGSDSISAVAGIPDLDGDSLISLQDPDASDCPNDPFGMGTYGTVLRGVEMPTVGINADNSIYVCYHAIDELSEPGTVESNFHKLFKHPYLIKSTDGGTTWTDYNKAFDVIKATIPEVSDQKEGSFACLAKRVDAKVHIVYQRDDYPGTSLATPGTCNQILNAATNGLSDIVYTSIDTSLSGGVGIAELPARNQTLAVSSNFPNPATDHTQFAVTLKKAINVTLNVTDLLGQNVYTENRGKLSEGIHFVTLNTSYLSSGVYFYTVTAGNEKITGKMIVQ